VSSDIIVPFGDILNHVMEWYCYCYNTNVHVATVQVMRVFVVRGGIYDSREKVKSGGVTWGKLLDALEDNDS